MTKTYSKPAEVERNFLQHQTQQQGNMKAMPQDLEAKVPTKAEVGWAVRQGRRGVPWLGAASTQQCPGCPQSSYRASTHSKADSDANTQMPTAVLDTRNNQPKAEN